MQALQKNDERRYLIYFGALTTLAYLIPLHVAPYPSFYNELVAAFALLILVAAYLHRRSVLIQLPSISLLPLGLAVIIMAQALLGSLVAPWDTFLASGYFLLAAMGIMVGASIAAEERGSERLCAAIAWSHLIAGLVSVVIASLQLAAIEHFFLPFAMLMRHGDTLIRPHANIAQANQLALLLCMGLASLWWLFQRSRVEYFLALPIAVILIWGLVLTQSRIAWLILPAFSIIVFWWRSTVGIRPVAASVLLGLLVVYVMLALALPDISSWFGSIANSPIVRARGGDSARIVLYNQAWEMSLAHFWVGAGWAQFGPQQIVTAPFFGTGVYSRHSHNLVLNFAAEFGWPLTLAFIVGIFFWLKSFLSKALNPQTALFCLFGTAIFLHSMVEFPLWYGYVLFPFSLLLGMAHQEKFSSPSRLVQRPIVALLTAISFSLLFLVAADYRRVVAGFTAMEFAAMGVVLDKSAMIGPSVTIFPHMYGYFAFLDIPITSEMSSQVINSMEQTAQRFGGVLMLTRMSQVYALNGAPDKAINTMIAIQRLHPASYAVAYETWRYAPPEFQYLFARMPTPD